MPRLLTLLALVAMLTFATGLPKAIDVMSAHAAEVVQIVDAEMDEEVSHDSCHSASAVLPVIAFYEPLRPRIGRAAVCHDDGAGVPPTLLRRPPRPLI